MINLNRTGDTGRSGPKEGQQPGDPPTSKKEKFQKKRATCPPGK